MSMGEALMAAGPGLSAFGTIAKGRADKVAADYNAGIADYNAGSVLNEGKFQVQRQQRMAAQQIGSNAAQYASQGINNDFGSALDILEASTAQSALDSETIKFNADTKAYGYKKSAALLRMEGETALNNSYLSAASTLLSGAGKTYGAMK